jgi:hypothetical protein
MVGDDLEAGVNHCLFINVNVRPVTNLLEELIRFCVVRITVFCVHIDYARLLSHRYVFHQAIAKVGCPARADREVHHNLAKDFGIGFTVLRPGVAEVGIGKLDPRTAISVHLFGSDVLRK